MASAVDNVTEILKNAIDQNDFETFRSTYRAFLSQFPAFNKSFSGGPAEVKVLSAIFGRTCFYLRQTSDTQATQLLTDSRAASKIFGSLSIAERLAFLKVLQEKIAKYQAEIELVITADTGKPTELSKGEMTKGSEWFDYAAQKAEEQIGKKAAGKQMLATKPLGAVQVIGAYNYPYALTIGGIIGALVTGNGVIISAPLKAPNWIFPFMQAAREAVEEFAGQAIAAGKPWAEAFASNANGLIQFSIGVNSNLTSNVDLVHFVGSNKVGEIISKSRGLKRNILEMGGSNIGVVMNSALDAKSADEIALALYKGFGPATGQRCTAPRILAVQEGAADTVVKALGRIIAESDHHIGNPLTAGTKMGPLVDSGAHQKMGAAIELAHELGATVYGDLNVNSNIVPQARDENSYWVKPVVIDWSTVDMTDPVKAERVNKVLADEIFGPLVHVAPRIKTIDDAIALQKKLDVNGLAGCIFTNSQEELDRYASNVEVTSLTVNDGPKDRSPWGPHGHPKLDTIGGVDHFARYVSNNTVYQEKPFTPKP